MNSIQKATLATISILSSEFIAQIEPCFSVQDAQLFQKSARETHPKANHHCFAYRIGSESIQEFASDDGEPGGTAGIPMLNVLKRNDLTNCCVIVTRYFGGTKLGKKGLIDAYRESVEKALENCKINPIEKRTRFKISYDYEQTSSIQKLIHTFSITIEQELFNEKVILLASINANSKVDLISRLESLAHIGVIVDDIEDYYS
jgi:uncharacterized YigZ family protein